MKRVARSAMRRLCGTRTQERVVHTSTSTSGHVHSARRCAHVHQSWHTATRKATGMRVRTQSSSVDAKDYEKQYRKGVGMCIVNDEGLVFAARRVDDPTETWQMPQGGIDSGEEPIEAALRELFEETGIESSSVRIIAEAGPYSYTFPTSIRKKIAKKYKGQSQQWFLMKFLSSEAEIDLAVNGEMHREFSEWRWMPFDEMPPQIVQFKQSVYEQVFSDFAPLINKDN